MILNKAFRNVIKTQMGTTISDSSHFTTFNRSILQCQATVIVTGFIPRFQDLRPLIRKFYPDSSGLACYSQAF
jgi:hypothetical protein